MDSRFHITGASKQGRRAPVVPLALEEELALRHFTNGKDNRPAVAMLYAEGFAARFGAVESLEYSELGWGDGEAKAVAAVLAAGAAPKLRELYLACNSIGDEGASALAGALPSATALRDLDLHSDSNGAEGASALAGALPSATALKVLNLHSSSIGDEGARARAGALPSAKALEVLHVGGKSIGAEAKAELRRACKERIPEIRLFI
jgi:hypothetical protein